MSTKIKWNKFPDVVPLGNFKYKKIRADFLVTVSLIHKDKHDTNEVTIATWDCMEQVWLYTANPKCIYGTTEWYVIAWAEKPSAFGEER